MKTEDPSSPTADPAETAAWWLARRDRGLTAQEFARFDAWLQADEAHAAAVARLGRAWAALDELQELRPEGAAAADPDLLRPGPPGRQGAGLGRRHRYAGLAAAAAVAVAGWLAWNVRQGPPAAPADTAVIYSTGSYEQRKITLADGSRLELNRSSTAEVQFAAGERLLRLVRGEGYFTVAKDPARPFVVEAGPAFVKAVGTEFNICLRPDGVEVLVTEGRVRVAPRRLGPADAEPSPQSPLVVAGQRVRLPGVEADRPEVTTLANREIAQVVDWRSPKLVFNEWRLADAVAQFNRHHTRQLVIGDPRTAEIRIDGTFRADNVDAFVRLLEAGFGVTAEARGNEIVLRSAP
ncbi:MAG: FecR domain-containing protein [Opitutaceae bacterium]|nr:FecR domain-containing protein [Opitutaceae bacterium]